MSQQVYTRRFFVKGALSSGAVAAVAGMGGLLSACSSDRPTTGTTTTPATTTPVDQVIVAMNAESEPSAGFDPMFSWGCGEHVHEPLIQSTLITTDTNLNFVNDLATGYECSSDGLTWTFHVRDDVKFTNGDPLSAEDVAFTIDSLINSTADGVADLSMVDSAKAIDATTVELKLNKPFNALLFTLAVVGIVPRNAYDADTYGSAPIGSGRYMLEQWDQGQQAIFVANPDYYGTAPKMKRVVVVFMEEDASLAACQAGSVDIAFTSATKSDISIDGYELLSCESVDSRGISLPTGKAGTTKADGDAEYPCGNDITSDIAVRRAMNYAVDREKMIENVLNGYGTPAYSVSDKMPWSSDDMKVKTDTAAAERFLTDAGWAKGSDGVYAKDGTRLSLNLWYASSDSVRQALANEFANQMAAIGIEITPRGGSWDGTDSLYTKEFSEPVLWGWGSNSPAEIYDLNYSTGWGNFADYKSTAVDAHLDAALSAPTIADSYDDWKAAQWDGTDGIAPIGAATWVWMANIDHLYFKKNDLNVADQKPHPHGHGWSLVNNVDTWTW